MSVWPVTGWQVVCDYPECMAVGKRMWEWAEALADWLQVPGAIALDPPHGVIPGRGSAARQHLTLCARHAVTVCARCGTTDLVVTDLEARRSWCAEHWSEVAYADLTAGKRPGVRAHLTDPERPGERKPGTKSEGIPS